MACQFVGPTICLLVTSFGKAVQKVLWDFRGHGTVGVRMSASAPTLFAPGKQNEENVCGS